MSEVSRDQHGALMDQIYRHTRHVYDLSRKYFLVGRDRLIRDLDLKPGERVCEVGCGTARNLVVMARRYPQAQLCGFDASSAMLETARTNLIRAGLSNVPLAQAYAEEFDAANDLPEGYAPIDRYVFSFCLTMIPDWQGALDRAWQTLPPGGGMALVDFGDMAGWPALLRRGFFAFLASFHAKPLPGIHAWAFEQNDAEVKQTRILGGYAILTQVSKRPG
jgi:S-adenosylmethionine-diacylgycerolhomoserine-N-methlytransferase